VLAVPIIITMAVPQYNKVLMHTRETAAMTAVQTVRDMQVQYQSQYGRFAKSLAQLGPSPGGGTASTPDAAGLIGSDLASGVKGGYNFAVTGDGSVYAVTATPVTYGTSGSRSFYMDQNMIMKEHYGPEPATASDKELGQGQK
jgi:type IV pilus assembly protein PilA